MFVLRLNDIRGPEDQLTDICLSEDKTELAKFVKKEKVKSYEEDSHKKVFRKGGPLEWFNLPASDEFCYLEIASEEDFIKAKREEYLKFLAGIPRLIKE